MVKIKQNFNKIKDNKHIVKFIGYIASPGATLHSFALILHSFIEQIEPPPHTIFSADRANEALAKIGRGLIPGRAILEFPEDDEDEEE